MREGKTKGDAYAAVAKERGLAVSSVRGAYPRASKSSTNGKAPKMPADPTEAAIAGFRAAIDGIDEQIAAVQERVNEATAELEALKADADQRKAEYEAKIAALS